MEYFKILLLFFILLPNSVSAQQKYWIVFADKSNTQFNPLEYFDPLAIDRRIKQNISLADSSDYPVNQEYINNVQKLSTSVSFASRWLNALSVTASRQQIVEIKKLSFVKKVVPIVYRSNLCNSKKQELDSFDLYILDKQTSTMNGRLFLDSAYTGKGIRIAVFDGGFPGVDTHEAFEHIRQKNRIIKTYDFCRKREFVYGYNAHGRMVLSNIAGKYKGKINMGLAVDAEFLLARTEVNAEPFSEEENWLAAAEWADKNGAHIISSSLGYTYNRYFNWDMDGKTSFVAKAAKMATQKGMLVVNAMGNDGDMDWKILGTPADVDSVLSIGGIDPNTNFHISFSSFGPNANGERKPNLVAFGQAVVAEKANKYSTAFGTSFSTPLVSGFAACVWQKYPNLTSHELFIQLEKSGNLYPYYDYAHGYGVPQANYFMSDSLNKTRKKQTFEIVDKQGFVKVIIKPEYLPQEQIDKQNYMYYHIANSEGLILKYWLIDIYDKNAVSLEKADWPDGKVLRVSYKGYSSEYKF